MKDYKTTTEIRPHLDIKEQTLEFESVTDGLIKQHFTETINFKDECVRKALIALGWTPPEDSL